MLGFQYTCQNCAARRADVRQRSVKTKNYMGPCGDSFCAVGCTSSACFPVTAALCDACNKSLAKDPL